MSKIDMDAIRAEVQMAQQTGRKMCSIHIDELMSLLMRADELAKVQSMVPLQAGFLWPEDLHRLKCGELHRIGLSRKKGPRYCLEARVQYLPSNMKGHEFNFDLKALLEASV